ncbi:hypothetical protein JCM10450v2_008331 [Rhodotorula kratochvilovae]
MRRQLGTLQTVYVAELEGLRLALATLATSPPLTEPTTVLVAIDNQAVLLQPTSPAPTSGQQHRLAVRALLLKLKRTHPMLELRLRWVPGHRNVAGNERTNEDAKRGAAGGGGGGGEEAGATQSSSSSSSSGDESEWEGRGQGEMSAEDAARVPPKSPPRLEQRGVLAADGLVEGGEELPKAISALWQQHKAEECARWEQEWAAAKVGRGLHRLAPSPSTAHRYHTGLTRRQAMLLARLRLDCAPPNSYLARTRQRGDGACECGEEETREHYIVNCPLHARARMRMLSRLPHRAVLALTTLLGNAALKYAVRDFITDMSRFPRYHDTARPEGDGRGQKGD